MPFFAHSLRAVVAVLALTSARAAQADEFTLSGYATLGAGKVISGSSPDDYLDFHNCPCAIVNYPDVGVYGHSVSFKPDSRAGVQMTWKPLDKLSFTGQLTSHAADNLRPTVDWAYASLDLTDSLTVQAGRKRLPLFGYSDFFQVGYAYPWIRPPGDVYGWQITAYNGANLAWRGKFGAIALNANVWTGVESDGNNRELGKLYYGDKVKERWKEIFGGYVEANYDWATLRFVVMTNKLDRYVGEGDARVVNKSGVRQDFYGLSGNIDYDNLVIRTELNRFVRPNDPRDIYNVYLVGAGYRFGDWLPMLTYTSFKENYKEDASQDEIHHTLSATLRWDVRPNMAIKLQYDIFKDLTRTPFVGDSKTIAVSLDYTF